MLQRVICFNFSIPIEFHLFKSHSVPEMNFRLLELKGCFALSVNEEYIDQGERELVHFSGREEIAIIPPLSGG